MKNDKNNLTRRRALRSNLTEPERRLWNALRKKQLGVKFRRQHGIGQYIVDFYCAERRLVIEVDGESHFTHEGIAYDDVRDRFLESCGLKVLHFTNQQVMCELEGVLSRIFIEVNKA
ncbi:endonuclease domain-containing protein [Zooshikella harenae]|uniref:Endonuclease domain-containing protein n=1 Tax=Zooshikella harenae TaxID=2827238 RepID=A0ABS5ZHY2_9GAMM|nr:endonuclease domain-containing protein [Zooshikella harenae]MBU2713540.1 endonuclease domain-containing protein [Zooshikella harenae]